MDSGSRLQLFRSQFSVERVGKRWALISRGLFAVAIVVFLVGIPIQFVIPLIIVSNWLTVALERLAVSYPHFYSPSITITAPNGLQMTTQTWKGQRSALVPLVTWFDDFTWQHSHSMPWSQWLLAGCAALRCSCCWLCRHWDRHLVARNNDEGQGLLVGHSRQSLQPDRTL